MGTKIPVRRAVKAIAKLMQDDERCIAYWVASQLTELDGTPLVDQHGDVIPEGEAEMAEVEFVKEYRVIDKRHDYVPAAELGGTMVLTRQLQAALVKAFPGSTCNLPALWIVKTHHPDAAGWAAVKDGAMPMLSIAGDCEPEEVGA